MDFVRYISRREMKKDFAALRTLKNYRWLMAIPVVLVTLTLTFTIGFLLYTYGQPILNFSWIQLIPSGDKTNEPQNLMVSGLSIPWFAWIFWVLLVINVPRLAKREERAFRQHTRGWKEALWQSVKFGLVHCFVGVPIAFGLALTIPGLLFAYTYSKGGIRLSTAWHAVYNWVILTFAMLFISGIL